MNECDEFLGLAFELFEVEMEFLLDFFGRGIWKEQVIIAIVSEY